MSTELTIKKGRGVPKDAEMAEAELALDLDNGTLYSKLGDGLVHALNEAPDADNYGHWKLQVDYGQPYQVVSGATANFEGTNGIKVTRTGDTVTIDGSELDLDEDADNYQYWTYKINGFSTTNVLSTQLLDFQSGDGIDIAKEGYGIKISATGGGGAAVHIGSAPPVDPQEGQQWMEVPASGDATMWIYDGAVWLQQPGGKDGADGVDGLWTDNGNDIYYDKGNVNIGRSDDIGAVVGIGGETITASFNNGLYIGRSGFTTQYNSEGLYATGDYLINTGGTSNGAMTIGANGDVSISGDVLAAKPDAGENALALGAQAGQTNQGSFTTAVGIEAGMTSQGSYSTALGRRAGSEGQGLSAVAVGNSAGQTNQRNSTVAIGSSAGNATQGEAAVAVGPSAGATNQGESSVAVGYLAGQTNQAANGIIINSSGTAVNSTSVGHIIIKSSTQEMRSIPTGGFAMNGDPIIGTRRLISTLSTLRNATKDETTLEGMRDALSDAIGGLIENLEHEIATQEISDE